MPKPHELLCADVVNTNTSISMEDAYRTILLVLTMLLLLLLLLLLMLGHCIETPLGPVSPLDPETRVLSFLGIPYALPPVGPRRFRPPEPHPGWSDPPSPNPHACIQAGGFLSIAQTQDEDCLTLNVFTGDVEAGAPVLVYIHGGGFFMGSSLHPEVSPSFLKFVQDTGVVVVSMNYRIGPFGALAHPHDEDISGNVGILDQKLALQFIKRYIKYFGGDPERITVFGNSAGAFSICIHLVMSAGLFRRAVLSSAICNFNFPTLQEGYEITRELCIAVNCTTSGAESIECLQKTDPRKLAMALPLKRGLIFYEGVRWFPVIDGKYIEKHPPHYVNTHELSWLDAIMFGNTIDEGSLFVLLAFPLYFSQTQLYDMLELAYGHQFAVDVLQYYNADSALSSHDVAKTMISDAWICAMIRFARTLDATSPDTAVYYYLLKHAFEFRTLIFPFLGAHHGSDLVSFNPQNEKLSSIETKLTRDFFDSLAEFVIADENNLSQALSWSSGMWSEFDDTRDILVLAPASHKWNDELEDRFKVCELWIQVALKDELTILFGADPIEPHISLLLNKKAIREIKKLWHQRVIVLTTIIAAVCGIVLWCKLRE